MSGTSELNALNQSLEAKNFELSRAQNFLQTVLDSSIEMVTAFDSDLNFTFINKRAHDFVLLDIDDRIGRNIRDVHPGFENTDRYQHLLRALNGEVVHVEARKSYVNEDLLLETFVLPLRHGDQVTGVPTLQRDVTAIIRLTEELKKANAELRRSNEDLQQFAHVTSHDLKEPVRKIRMFADLVQSNFENQIPEKAIGHINKIESSARRIANMVDGILQYSSIDVMEQTMDEVDLNRIVGDILEDLEMLTSEKKARSISPLPVVKGSVVLLNQLFYNLINNALKFSRAGVEPVLVITSREVAGSELEGVPEASQGQRYFNIDISDNGIGSIRSTRNGYSRLNAKDKFEGAGLGLALCKKIVQRHNGFIRAHGKPNEGATFSVYLP